MRNAERTVARPSSLLRDRRVKLVHFLPVECAELLFSHSAPVGTCVRSEICLRCRIAPNKQDCDQNQYQSRVLKSGDLQDEIPGTQSDLWSARLRQEYIQEQEQSGHMVFLELCQRLTEIDRLGHSPQVDQPGIQAKGHGKCDSPRFAAGENRAHSS